MEAYSGILINLVIITLLLLTNAFFVASEFALVSVRQTKILQLSNEGNLDAKLALKAIHDIDRYVAAVQLGITISSIGIGWVGESTLARIIEPIFDFLPSGIQAFATHTLAVGIAFAIITLLHVVVGELMPKSIALQYPEKTALWVAKPMYVITKLFAPFIYILNGLGNYLLKLMRIEPARGHHLVHSTEELNMLIDASFKGGVLNETEAEMLQNVFKFSDLIAKQVMIPRPDMVCIPLDIEENELKKLILENQYTRYPVYDTDLDHIVGILHVKDLYPLIVENNPIDISKLQREPLLVPETMTMDNLAIEFKKQKGQMAIVVDEFGGTSGLITLEDVLEEIFGEVQDEFDEEEADIKQIAENTYEMLAKVRVDELGEFFGIEIDEEDIETIGGLVVKRLGRLAEEEDMVEDDYFKYQVLEIDGARIVKLRVERIFKEADEQVGEGVEI